MKGLHFVFFCRVFKCGKGTENLHLTFVLVDKHGSNLSFGGLLLVLDLKRYFHSPCGILRNSFHASETSRRSYCEVMHTCSERGRSLLRLFS